MEFDGNSSGYQRTISHLLPAPLCFCYQHAGNAADFSSCILLNSKGLSSEAWR
jgi:hypothetical protein